jgi:hypothetical protein
MDNPLVSLVIRLSAGSMFNEVGELAPAFSHQEKRGFDLRGCCKFEGLQALIGILSILGYGGHRSPHYVK